ncbi:MAG: low-specificity L-threonine aldolase [Spirochaetes bacterium]|nr:low-specificity L-threonine aldolase [Spirochaetota bacterium]
MVYDFRSDTVTKPSAPMRKAMAEAEVGDDVYRDDPTVNLLEERAAELMGKEAALFAPSGTQTNLLAILTHCGRGDEYIVGQDGHSYKYEGGGAAIFGSIVPQPIEFEPDGTLDLAKVKSKIKPNDIHFARTKLLCLENTNWGRVLPMDYLAQASEFAKIHHLSTHLDGARIFNAAVKLKIPALKIAQYFDTVSFCLSKGLGAPVGSLLCGKREFIEEARRWRKVLGGGMRQVGILAAAGLYALDHNIGRLEEDHMNAALLTERLKSMPEMEVLPYSGITNMVFAYLRKGNPEGLAAFLKDRGILITVRNPLRLVTHMDVDRKAVVALVEGIKEYLAKL